MGHRALAHPLACLALAACAAVIGGAVDARDAAYRSRAVRADFMREHPCPATGARRGACPGYQVDHRTPLCNGGADHADNLQWLSVEAHKHKTRTDVRLCRMRKRTP